MKSGPDAAGRPRLTVVAGPSGVGKSSVLAEVRRRLPAMFMSVSVTTRSARRGERDGEHYHFVTRSQFERMVADGRLLEHAEYAGQGYGTPREPVERHLAEGRPAVLEIEVQGARQVKAAMPESVLVMLLPPSWETLVERLSARGTDDPAVVEQRLRLAREELGAADEFDVTIVNDDVQRSAEYLVTLISEPSSAPEPSASEPWTSPGRRSGTSHSRQQEQP